MLFNSHVFIFLFLPLTLSGYYIINNLKQYKYANIFLIGMSLCFYGYFNLSYLLIICGSILGNYFCSRGIQKTNIKTNKLIILSFGIIINVLLLFYFKYYNFFLQNINNIFNLSFEIKHIVLPLGISFFTFQQISYLVDSYKEPALKYTFEEYALYVAFFPQLIAGPIVLHNELIPQFKNIQNRHIIPQNFSKGMYIFSSGLFKKVIIADTFARAVAYGFGNIAMLSSMEALIISFSYTFQLYFDFSGYCDMAVGIGYMFNIKLPVNFNSPYKSKNIISFWERWHISLTRFLKTYIYIPLGGNRKGRIRTYLNIMFVFFISGIWHGANWTFILWGIIHGVLNCLNRFQKHHWEQLEEITQWVITFMSVNLLWILFRSENITSAILFFKKLCCMSSFTVSEEIYKCFNLTELIFLEKKIPYLNTMFSSITGINLWIFLFGSFFVVLNFPHNDEIEFRPTLITSFKTIIFMIWSIISFAGISTFLYFDF